jgi:hypothetical protein
MLERWNLSNTRHFPSQLKVSLQISVSAVVRSMGWKLGLINYRTDERGRSHILILMRDLLFVLLSALGRVYFVCQPGRDEYAVAQPHCNMCLGFVWVLSTRHNNDNITPGGASVTGCQ